MSKAVSRCVAKVRSDLSYRNELEVVVVARCEMCGKKGGITYDAHRQRQKKGLFPVCSTCLDHAGINDKQREAEIKKQKKLGRYLFPGFLD